MSKRVWVAGAVALSAVVLGGCAAKTPKGVFAGRSGPNEFVVGRAQPLTVPPDFALVPPRPGAPRPQEADSSTQALNALFGGPAQTSAGEQALIQQAGGEPAPGIRSEAGAPGTTVINKGSGTRDILNAPPTEGKDAKAGTTAAPAATTPPKP